MNTAPETPVYVTVATRNPRAKSHLARPTAYTTKCGQTLASVASNMTGRPSSGPCVKCAESTR
jgi:hypothetical protein